MHYIGRLYTPTSRDTFRGERRRRINDIDDYEKRIERDNFDRDVNDHEVAPNFHADNMVNCDEGDAYNDIGVQHVTNTTIAYTPPASSFYANAWENMVDPSCFWIPSACTWQEGMSFSKGLIFANKWVVKHA